MNGMGNLERIIVYFTIVLINQWIIIQTEEICIGDYFTPACGSGEIIIMQHAQFGRMRLGKCVEEDIGYLGCGTDVLNQLDDICSGKSECNLQVTNQNLPTAEGCRKGLEKFLEASFICKRGQHLPKVCGVNEKVVITILSHDSYIASDEIKSSCLKPNQPWILTSKPGQSINISVVNLERSQGSDVYGTIKEQSTDRQVVFGGGPREAHLIMSSESVEVTVQSNAFNGANFLLHIQVQGCANIEPPEGAWMTRNGDVMEIGCHSGAKSWTMTCENNQWTGAVGQCGQQHEEEIINPDNEPRDTAAALSLNAVLFAICSLVIFASSIVFIIGVCLLKRNMNLTANSSTFNQPGMRGNQPTLLPDRTLQPLFGMDSETMNRNILVDPKYKSLQMTGTNDGHANPMGITTYMNTAQSDERGTVQYYVLDDIGHSK